MVDLHTDELLVFECRRWLSEDQDDRELCRELPALRPGEPVLPGKVQPNNTTGAMFTAKISRNTCWCIPVNLPDEG